MKPRLRSAICNLPFAILLALATACTHFDANKGTLTTCADNEGLDARFANGARIHIDRNSHSPVIHAYGSAGGRLIGAAGAAFIGYAGVKQGQDALALASTIAPSHYNRATSRATATPLPSPAK